MPIDDFKLIKRKTALLLGAKREILAAYIFGSVATGRPRPDSDIDIAVLVSDEVMGGDVLKYRIELMTQLMQALGRDNVDLIVLNEAPPLLAHRVLKHGKLIVERSASARVAFQVRTVNRYLDTQPMRNLYLSYLKKHAREGKIFG